MVVEEVAFLRCLDAVTEQRRHVSHMPAANFAPKVFAGMSEASGVSRKALEQAMERLFSSGEIVANQNLWRDEKNRRWAIGIARKPRANPQNEGAQTPRKPERAETDIDAVFEDKVVMFQTFERNSSSAQTTAQTLHQTPRKPRANPAQTRAHTPLYPT